MATIFDIQKKYRGKLDYLDLELIIAHAIKKSREFVLSHPEKKITKKQETITNNFIERRIECEPLAYILGKKEFYGLKFKVNKNTLIPRPETEMMVDLATKNLQLITNNKKLFIIDIGTGSGNIIIAIAKQLQNLELRIKNLEFIGIDISKKALQIAKQNAKTHKVDKKIKFIHGNLLEPFIKKLKIKNKKSKNIIIANLPYGWSAWKNNSSAETIGIKFEPSIALFTGKKGLELYEKLLMHLLQFKKNNQNILALLEIDPRQSAGIKKMIKKYFPKAKITFYKDLSGKWRLCELKI
ncbi:MAG: peptide chain release factor N(5)-glutamine methyltransferase [Patescibacteria group bacterium]